MSGDIVDQVVTGIKESPVRIRLQLNKSTDVDNMSHLVVFVRHVANDLICDEFLLCKTLALTERLLTSVKS